MENGKKINVVEKVREFCKLGKCTYPNNETYVGDWKDNMRDGIGKIQNIVGTYSYRNGDKYDGQWKNDIRLGKGFSFLILRVARRASQLKCKTRSERQA